MRPVALLAALLLVPGALTAQRRFTNPLTIGTVDSIRSATLDETRPYLVYTPPSYGDTTVAPARYPVLYLLDGDAHFHSVSGLIQILGTGVNGTFVVPEMIVVAIPNTDRTRDLTPTHTDTGFDGKPTPAFKTSGGGPKFLQFLRDELIPRIESQYRTMPYRVFVGHSFGGITTLNALYTMPELFNAYVAIDPSLWWDNRVLLWKAKDVVSTGKLSGRSLFVAQANTITPDDTTTNRHFESIGKFNSIVDAYNTSGLRYGFKYYDHDDHGSVPMIAEYDALRFIFAGYQVPLARVLARPALLTEHFETVSRRLGAEFRPTEGMVRLFAEVALGQDTAKAVSFLEMDAQLYPDSYRPLDRLGAIWLARGDRARARDYFERSLRKNPGNEATREKLKTLAPK
ncbi:MAG: alpha/beta hydrolase-fold protein [Gemmatimonadales bacterium]